mmetsp:Transcript_12288/g.26576  ORF Transcript_12288/g.26576 Transcript_12288/m.26576 type:complete len:89 (+) Transcript_12288:468-734(+)|eukprot:6172562-Pleurochrysis_carterae.AAC.1
MDAGPKLSTCKVRAMHAITCDIIVFMSAREHAYYTHTGASSHAHMYMYTRVTRSSVCRHMQAQVRSRTTRARAQKNAIGVRDSARRPA